MRVGIIGIRYTKGIGVVAEDFARLIESLGHIVYFLGYPLSHRKSCLTTGEWKRDRVTIVNTFNRNTVRIGDATLAEWVAGNRLDIVFTIEEPNNANTFSICKKLGVPIINYIDIEKFDASLKEIYKDCSLFFCPTQMCYDKMFEYGYQNLMFIRYMANIHKYPWIHRDAKSGPVEMVMHGGWGGASGRKGVEPTVRAFVQANHSNTHLTILTQKKWKTYDEETQKLVDRCKRIKVREVNNTDAVYNADAYSFGHMVIQPSKWEGLGLTYIEALVSGLPVITTNAPPMNEFVQHEKTGLLVECDMVPGKQIQSDLKIPAALVKEDILAETIRMFGDNPSYIASMSTETEKFRNKHADYRQAFSDMLKRFE